MNVFRVMNKPFGLSFFLNDFTVILFESPYSLEAVINKYRRSRA